MPFFQGFFKLFQASELHWCLDQKRSFFRFPVNPVKTIYICRKLNLTKHKRWKEVKAVDKLGIDPTEYYRIEEEQEDAMWDNGSTKV